MEKQAFFQDFQQKVMDLIKASPAADIERNIKALMGQTFNKLELVSREEFDIQQQVLIKTRTKLVELEERLAKLEAAQEPEQSALEAAEAAAKEAVAEIKQQTETGE